MKLWLKSLHCASFFILTLAVTRLHMTARFPEATSPEIWPKLLPYLGLFALAIILQAVVFVSGIFADSASLWFDSLKSADWREAFRKRPIEPLPEKTVLALASGATGVIVAVIWGVSEVQLQPPEENLTRSYGVYIFCLLLFASVFDRKSADSLFDRRAKERFAPIIPFMLSFLGASLFGALVFYYAFTPPLIGAVVITLIPLLLNLAGVVYFWQKRLQLFAAISRAWFYTFSVLWLAGSLMVALLFAETKNYVTVMLFAWVALTLAVGAGLCGWRERVVADSQLVEAH